MTAGTIRQYNNGYIPAQPEKHNNITCNKT